MKNNFTKVEHGLYIIGDLADIFNDKIFFDKIYENIINNKIKGILNDDTIPSMYIFRTKEDINEYCIKIYNKTINLLNLKSGIIAIIKLNDIDKIKEKIDINKLQIIQFENDFNIFEQDGTLYIDKFTIEKNIKNNETKEILNKITNNLNNLIEIIDGDLRCNNLQLAIDFNEDIDYLLKIKNKVSDIIKEY